MKQKALEYIRKKNTDGLRKLFKKGLNPNEKYLREAIMQAEDNDMLLKALVDYRMVSGLSPEFEKAYFAIKEGNTRVLDKLLDKGLDVNSSDSNNRSLFTLAARFDRPGIMENLIARSADITSNPGHFNPELDSFMKLALHEAIYHNSMNALRFLLPLTEVSDEEKAYAYFLAAERANPEALNMILDTGIDPDILYRNITVLAYIVYRLRVYDPDAVRQAKEITRLLVERGADPRRKDKDGHAASEIAFSDQKTDFGRFLRSLEGISDEEQAAMQKKYKFPESVIDYLNKNREKLRFDFSGENELAFVRLCVPETLYTSVIELDPGQYNPVSPGLVKDPNNGRYGCYRVPVVNLIEECPAYSETGILVWVPAMGMFGTADTDHRLLYLFQDNWEYIISLPESHCCYQWNEGIFDVHVVNPWECGKPWEMWDFREF